MKRSFWSTIRGKFVTRTLLTALVPSVLIGAITVFALRSFSTNAEESVAAVHTALGDGVVLAPLDDFAADVSSASARVTIMLVLAMFAGIAGATIIALTLARRITSPIALLSDNAATAAEVTLPDFVSQIDSFIDSDTEAPELTSLMVPTGDEVEDLSRSFNVMQQTAASLALEQARTRHQSVSTFVNLGRRNQNLLARQIEAINSMEQMETNPQVLEQLFHLDHLATRMRRNAQSLLVLADEEAPRRFRKPVSMHQLVQAASGEIEHFSRIESGIVDDVHVDGGPASDLAHLLAELLENATAFAPPGSAVEVTGHETESGYELQILDRGIGMDEDGLAGANKRLADHTNFQFSRSTTYLGHYVVGRLAKRHGVRVELSATAPEGITARVSLPATLLATDRSEPSGRRSASVASSTDPAARKVDTEISSTDYELLRQAVSQVPVQLESTTETPSDPVPAKSEDATPPARVSSTQLEQVEAIEWALRSSPDTTPQINAVSPDQAPAAGLTPQPVDDPRDVAGIAPATTPAGFRRRRRGEEGAPQALAGSQDDSLRVRRSPEEVQAALQRFSVGVETGRAASHSDTQQSEPAGETT